MPRRADSVTNGIGTGPSWYDAWELANAMERNLGERIEFRIAPSKAANQRYGWRVTALLEKSPSVYGCGCFGPAFPGNGQKSFAASVYRALIALDEQVSIQWGEEDQEAQMSADFDSEA